MFLFTCSPVYLNLCEALRTLTREAVQPVCGLKTAVLLSPSIISYQVHCSTVRCRGMIGTLPKYDTKTGPVRLRSGMFFECLHGRLRKFQIKVDSSMDSTVPMNSRLLGSLTLGSDLPAKSVTAGID